MEGGKLMVLFGGRLTRAWLYTAGVGLLATGAAMVVAPNGSAFGLAAGGQEATERSRLQRDADEVAAAGATGLVVAVDGADGGHRRARAGEAEVGTGTPVPWQPYYRIGSDSKTFTSVVLLQLVDEGEVSLSDTVEHWLPGVVAGAGNDGSRITVENLLRHTSGLANYTDILFDLETFTPEFYQDDRFTVRSPREQVALAMTRAPGWLPDAADPAGETRWSYSNTNYLLAGMIIERITGHTWEREVHERIIEPLGLTRTISPGSSVYVPEPTAHGYLQFPGEEELTDTTLVVGGGADGGLLSTPSDMNTFLRAVLDGTLLSPERVADLQRTVPAPDFGPGAEYGLGLVSAPRCGSDEPPLWFHGGTSFGTVSEGAVTADGSAAASAAIFTLRLGDLERQEAQDEATRAMIDHALCDDGR
ncbi:serine hydrolase domain-containing protein [Streptomyces sp. DSM 44915]|uniref:Serine hydrolase domain-containing protein n=1 Tax=Streptomyces chisholmiae TaxID=3075540 RepID=A0ABU2JN30_9ACTN|nr:serine hydrolase domain-containing protein [Streptomyces sp. DSM 44915]MDT0266390.1 serine hydrolase domain-containing protein [Streptomyces sp. DSM 44915]